MSLTIRIFEGTYLNIGQLAFERLKRILLQLSGHLKQLGVALLLHVSKVDEDHSTRLLIPLHIYNVGSIQLSLVRGRVSVLCHTQRVHLNTIRIERLQSILAPVVQAVRRSPLFTCGLHGSIHDLLDGLQRVGMRLIMYITPEKATLNHIGHVDLQRLALVNSSRQQIPVILGNKNELRWFTYLHNYFES